LSNPVSPPISNKTEEYKSGHQNPAPFSNRGKAENQWKEGGNTQNSESEYSDREVGDNDDDDREKKVTSYIAN
jgi:hypothetical protein